MNCFTYTLWEGLGKWGVRLGHFEFLPCVIIITHSKTQQPETHKQKRHVSLASFVHDKQDDDHDADSLSLSDSPPGGLGSVRRRRSVKDATRPTSLSRARALKECLP